MTEEAPHLTALRIALQQTKRVERESRIAKQAVARALARAEAAGIDSSEEHTNGTARTTAGK